MSKDSRSRNINLALELLLAVIRALGKSPASTGLLVAFLAGAGVSFYPDLSGFLTA